MSPEVKIEFTPLSWDTGNEKKRIAIASKDYPDITAENLSTIVSLIEGGIIEPVDEYLTEEDMKDYIPAAINAFKFKNRIWGFPWNYSGELLFINLDLFKERKISPPKDGFWTYEEFVEN